MTLPFMLQEFDRVIVVDWSCPQKSGEFAASLGASVHYKYGERYFCKVRAQNYGAKLATSDYLAFVDADTICTPGTGAEIRSLLDARTMILSARQPDGYDLENLFGFLVTPTDAFWNVGGYDESFVGWGHEDSHLRGKLHLEAGLRVKRLDGMTLGAIAHSNAMRHENSEDKLPVSAGRNWQKLLAYYASHGIDNWMQDPRTADITFRLRP